MVLEKWSCVEKFGLRKWLLAILLKMVARYSECVRVSVTVGKVENVIRVNHVRIGRMLQ